MDPTQSVSGKLVLGVILPHTKLFGGVRRFFELGEILHRRLHQLIVFTPDGAKPDWFSYSGRTEKLDNLQQYELDALFITETKFLDYLISAKTKLKVFYHVGPRGKLNKVLKQKDIVVFTNSSNMYELDKRKYGIETVKAFGGVHIPEHAKEYNPGNPIKIMAYGRLTRKGKGTSLVIRACEKLYSKGYPVKLILFDSPIDDLSDQKIKNFKCNVPYDFIINHPVSKNDELFKMADIFVAAEKKGGWSNTAAEALAAGIPLIGTKTGTKDFLIDNETGLRVWRFSFFIRRALEKLINDRPLAARLARKGREKISEYSWLKLADFIEEYVSARV